MANICNINFSSQYAFVDDKQIHIRDCNLTHKDKFRCQNNHELIAVHPKKKKPHFRHKNISDTGGEPMTEWHCEWQSYFPVIEKSFFCKPTQIKERRADVVLNDTTILEIQHSKYERTEIDNRKHDYSLHNINIIWLIDGNENINVNILHSSKRYFLEFQNDYWRYESFKGYDYIYIDINSQIYKVNPNMVKSHMIDVETPKQKIDFIESIKNGIDLWSNEEPHQCTLFIKQQGAGNGKTFGIIKMLEDNDKNHYDTFIYITKQHSAKHIIKCEFVNQMKDFLYLKNIEITETNKKYIIKYYNEISCKNCQIIISTIESFTWSIGNKNHNELDKFEGIINSIIDGHIETSESGVIKYASINPKLNKKTLLVIDEFQDPPDCYAKAILRIMRDKYPDVYIVGDKLQSISNEQNAFTFFLQAEMPYINVVKLEPTNICRRFTHPKLVEFVNFIVPFEKYQLPSINSYKIDIFFEDEQPLIFFKGDNINIIENDKNNETINKNIDKIMEYYKNEVDKNNRFPEDFLIVTPFTQKNPLVDALTLSINIFWQNKFTDNIEYMNKWNNTIDIEKYYKYAIFHKSEQGTSINLTESDKSTRIVSCHSSKGDGRNVVFLIGFTQSAIEAFSRSKDNLVYNSLIHVAVTRMKQKLYIRYEENYDDIHKKIQNFNKINTIYDKEVNPDIKIFNKIKYSNFTNESCKLYFDEYYNKIIKNVSNESLINDGNTKIIIDMGNHNIRYSTLIITILIEIINREKFSINSDTKKQIKAILYKISNAEHLTVDNFKKYYRLLENKEDIIIPILKISNKGAEYVKYFNIINDMIIHIQDKLRIFLKDNNELVLCPLECIILYFMIEIVENKKYSSITIGDIYDIIDVYHKGFENIFLGHDNCLCKKHCIQSFLNKNEDLQNNQIKLYLKNHYDKTRNIKYTVQKISELYPNINWLYNHSIKYDGNDNFKISKHFTLIGYNETVVINCYIKPQFNELNYNETLMTSIYDTHLLSNICKLNDEGQISKNYNKFNGKNIISCIFTLDYDKPYLINWKNMNNENLILKNNSLFIDNISKYIKNLYIKSTYDIFYFYNYWRNCCPEDKKSPTNFISFIQEKLRETEKKHIPSNYPRYIYDFFSNIEFEIGHTKGKNNKELILKKYEDMDYFTESIEETLDKSIKSYLKINLDEEDDDY
jgi:hypothetical protein